MQRIAFMLRLKPGAGAAYDRAHQQVWPEMLELLKSAGISEYSIFRRDELLLLVMRVEQDSIRRGAKSKMSQLICAGKRR